MNGLTIYNMFLPNLRLWFWYLKKMLINADADDDSSRARCLTFRVSLIIQLVLQRLITYHWFPFIPLLTPGSHVFHWFVAVWILRLVFAFFFVGCCLCFLL